MTQQLTVYDRANIILLAITPTILNTKQERQVDELLYTLSEADLLPHIDICDVKLIYSLVNLVKDNKYSEEMSL